MNTNTSAAAAALGRMGGKSKSPAKQSAARANGRRNLSRAAREEARNEFIRGFAAALRVTEIAAEEHWAAYSRQLSDRARRREEVGGYRAGFSHGLEYLELT